LRGSIRRVRGLTMISAKGTSRDLVRYEFRRFYRQRVEEVDIWVCRNLRLRRDRPKASSRSGLKIKFPNLECP